MSNKGRKRPRSKPRNRVPRSKRERITIFSVIVTLATLCGYVVLVPRVTAVLSDPTDPNDPFSSSVTITNTGSIPLKTVIPSVSFRDITFLTPQGKPLTLHGDMEHQKIRWKTWSPHDLGIDDRFTLALNDFFGGTRQSLVSAQIAIVVDYELPLIRFHQEKRFPVFAKRQSNGNFYWYADTFPVSSN